MKSPYTCNHENLKPPIAGGARKCEDCGHILNNYILGQVERAEKAEAEVEELRELITMWSMDLQKGESGIGIGRLMEAEMDRRKG